jgi:O-antigen ligase
MQFLVPLVAALVPLLITPGLVSYFDITPKIAILLLGVALIVLYREANASNVRALAGATAGRLFIGLLGAEWLSTAIASVSSANWALSLDGGTWRRYGLISETGLLLFVLLASGWLARDQRNIRILLEACTLAGTLAALYGIAQYFGFDPFLPRGSYEVGDEPFRIVRPPGTLGHADYFADWLLTVTFVALALGALEKKPWRKRRASAAALLTAGAILLTGTRAALLGLFAGVLVFIFARGTRIRAHEVALGFACAAGLVLFFFSPPGARLRARLHWSVEDTRGGARLLLWRDSLRMASHRPLSGFGPETFGTDFPRFESLELARAYPDFYHESPHNIFVDTLTGEGVIGLVTLLCLCGLGAWAAERAWRYGHPLAGPLAAAFAGVLVSQQFAAFIFTNSLYFHLLLAMLIVIVLPRENLATSPAPRSPWILPLSLAVSILLAGFAIRLISADRALAVAQQHIASNDAKGAAEAYRNALRWQAPGAGDDLAYSRAMQQLAVGSPIFATKLLASQEALESGIRAVTTAEDRQNAWYNLATILATRNDAAGVERSLRNAIAWAPNWFKPHWTLAQFLELTNRHDEALAEARKAVECDGNKDPEVSETWKKLGGTPH